jgi:hypothetical protein
MEEHATGAYGASMAGIPLQIAYGSWPKINPGHGGMVVPWPSFNGTDD